MTPQQAEWYYGKEYFGPDARLVWEWEPAEGDTGGAAHDAGSQHDKGHR